MANTFKAMCELADWNAAGVTKQPPPIEHDSKKTLKPKDEIPKPLEKGVNPQLHYNIQIHLPESRDPAVFDAIFRSLKEHLL